MTSDPIALLKHAQCGEGWEKYPKIYTLEILAYYEDGSADNCGMFTFRLPERAQKVTPIQKLKPMDPEKKEKQE